jgi:predicted ester cyclase
MEAAQTQAVVELDRETVEGFGHRWLEAWNDHDVEALVWLCTEDISLDDPALPETLHGHEGVRRFGSATFRTFPDLHIEELEPPYLSPLWPKALSPYRFRATMEGPWEFTNIAPTGARVDFVGIDEWELRDGRLARYRTKYDLMEVARQMGILPARGTLGDRILTRLQHIQARGQRRRSR